MAPKDSRQERYVDTDRTFRWQVCGPREMAILRLPAEDWRLLRRALKFYLSEHQSFNPTDEEEFAQEIVDVSEHLDIGEA